MYASNEISILQNHLSLRVGFEPTREDPIWFLVKRLNHSAIAACLMRWWHWSKRTIVDIHTSWLEGYVDHLPV